MCTACGKIIKNEVSDVNEPGASTTIKTVTSSLTLHGGSTLQVSKEEAKAIQASKIANLRQMKKIALVLDLDHTLLHAIQVDGPCPPIGQVSQKDRREGIAHLPIEEVLNGVTKHLIMKARPHLEEFLRAAHEFCQMTIYTAGEIFCPIS